MGTDMGIIFYEFYGTEMLFCSLLSLRFLTLYRFASAHFSNSPWASDSEKCPEHSLAAGPLQLIGRVPKKCSDSRLAKKHFRFKDMMPKWAIII